MTKRLLLKNPLRARAIKVNRSQQPASNLPATKAVRDWGVGAVLRCWEVGLAPSVAQGSDRRGA
jgi:hypothetical protein